MKRVLLIAAISSILCACGTAHVAIQIDDEYRTDDETKVVLGETKNETGNEYDVDITGMLESALEKQLRENKILSSLSDKGNIVIVSRIMEYEKGDAFKRWLMPGYGSTKLSVNSDIKDSQGNIVGSITSKHTVDSGGAYSVGAWEKIFGNVSKDIVKELIIELRENQES